MKRLLLAAFAVFFVSASWAQEVPRPKPAEKAPPDCITASEFLEGYNYSMGYHKQYRSGVFAYVEEMDAIIILPMSGPCVASVAGLVLKRGMKGFRPIYTRIMNEQGV